MKISRHDKVLLLEREILALLLLIIISIVFYSYRYNISFYMLLLASGFAFYFWMLYEERIHKTGKKHSYFEHTSSYIMLAQSAVALGLLFMLMGLDFLMFTFNIISVVMYSVSLSNMILYKIVFPR
ncbi:hypothetical protein JXB28_02610 [Candidatus Woesearchaeota archaeon]|nr:hypothetical protein [Candidatus Woesearchaeota archaeon]